MVGGPGTRESAPLRPDAPGRVPAVGPLARTGGELLYLATRLSVGTLRLRADGLAALIAAKSQGRSLVLVGWHGHDFVNLGVYHKLFGRDARGAIMVRDNRAGLTLVQFCQRMRVTPVLLGHDPAQTQWARGVVAMIRLVRAGYDALLAADGPEGPAFVAKPGVAVMAQRAGALLVPVATFTTPSLRLKNRWDAQMVPLPFGRGVIHFGDPIETTPPDAEPPTAEALRERLQAGLDAGVERSRTLCQQWTDDERE